MLPKVYIDGHVGTTGLRIREWLAGRNDIELLTLAEAQRKSEAARRAVLAEADVAILCLPNAASREAAEWAAHTDTRLIDASTAHRVEDGWVYGLPELRPDQRASIRQAKYVANPGCYPSAFLLLVRPLLEAGLLAKQTPISIHALSGYSGGGRPLIEKWEDTERGLGSLVYEAPYALERVHKHVPEMTRYSPARQCSSLRPRGRSVPLWYAGPGADSYRSVTKWSGRYDLGSLMGALSTRAVCAGAAQRAALGNQRTQLRPAGLQRHQSPGHPHCTPSRRPCPAD